MLLLACICSAAIYFIRTEQYKNWMPTEGVVVEIEEYYSTGGRHHIGSGYSHRIFYSYILDGQSYSGSNLYSGRDEGNFLKGQSVQIWYNPQKVSESSFHKPGPGLDPYVPFIMGVPLTGVALRIAGQNRRRSTILENL